MHLRIFVTAFIVLLAGAGNASALTICIKQSAPVVNNQVDMRTVVVAQPGKCAHGYVKMTEINTVAGIATVDKTGNVLGFSGANTTAVTSKEPSDGIYDVTFKGKFPGLSKNDSLQNRKMILIHTLGTSDNYDITNAKVMNASASKIELEFHTWNSNTTTNSADSGGNIAFIIGRLH